MPPTIAFVTAAGPGRRIEVHMRRSDNRPFSARRSFLSRLGSGFVAVNDAIWSKYVASMTSQTTDPKTNAVPTRNPYNSAESRRDETFDALIKLGVHFAVCDKSTQGLAGSLARKTEGKSDAVYQEMLANVIGSSHMVASGIVAVGHAQEHGYAYAYCG